MSVAHAQNPTSPDAGDYARWREHKLDRHGPRPVSEAVDIADPRRISREESKALADQLSCYNFARYRIHPDSRDSLLEASAMAAFGHQLGLRGALPNPGAGPCHVSAIRADAEKPLVGGYIPYTRKALNWHTDGYYNHESRRVRSFLLHCHRPALFGGKNTLMDHEILYILLRDRDPGLSSALFRPDAFSIPATISDGQVLREAFTGPVFENDPADGRLAMRYTRRTRNIKWHSDPRLREAVAAVDELLDRETDWQLRLTLAAGEGLVCNNLLHARMAFEDHDDPALCRHLSRIRYHQRVDGHP